MKTGWHLFLKTQRINEIIFSIFRSPTFRFPFSFAQSDKAFEASNFQKELMNLLDNTKQPDCQAAAKNFENSWLKLNGSQQNSMIEIANLMRTRKCLWFHTIAIL